MSVENNFLKNLIESFASRTVVTILGVIGTLIGIYAYFEDKEVNLQYEIIANTNVLDFNAEISKLEVTYDSTNLKKTNKNLRLVTLKVINTGDKDILKEYYDDNDLVGLKIDNGQIIEKPQLIESSSNYLKKNFSFNYNHTTILFPKIILEQKEYAIIKILLLHKKNSMPKIISIGKIAGQKNIAVLNAVDVKNQASFIEKTYFGNIWVQLLRLISYFIIAVIIIIIIALISEQLDERKEVKRKLKYIENFKKSNDYHYTRMDDAIFDRYKDGGLYELIEMEKLLISEEKVNKKYKKLSDTLKNKFKSNIKRSHASSEQWQTLNNMINDGILIRELDNLGINLAMKDTIEKFIVFLQQNEEKSHKTISFDLKTNRDEINDEENF